MVTDDELIITTNQLQNITNVPSLPSVSSIPNLTTVPSLPSVSSIPNLTNVQSLPSLPSVPSIPNLTVVPPLPSVPSIPNLNDQTRPIITSYIPENIIESNKKSIFESEDQVLIIHSICDIILFYMVFRYISNMFSHTKQNIINCRESLQKLREQYGLQID